MYKETEYDVSELGERARVIPGPEPVLNRAGEVIPVSEPDLDTKAEEYVLEAMRSNWISSRGEFLNLFEEMFAEKVGARHAIAVNSGTSALHLALAALDISPGDEVIVPAFTMVSTGFAVSYMGATPVFVDCDEYYQINPKLIGEAITARTKAIIPVHIYGHPVDMDAIEAFDLPVIYDAAESHGALYKGQPIGGRGLANCYSFYANKIITTGEGGMVVTNDDEFAAIARGMKDVSFSTERHFWHKRLGFNFRMTNLTAALGVSQVERFDYLVERHVSNACYYQQGLQDVPGLRFAKTAEWAKNVHWMFGMEVEPKFGMSRDQLREFLAKKGIETRTFFVPLHLQPYYYHEHGRGSEGKFPVAERLSERGLYLPSSSTLKPEQMDKVIEAIKEAYMSYEKR